jgi:hypothetical protein
LDTAIGLRKVTSDDMQDEDDCDLDGSTFDLKFTKYRDMTDEEAAPMRLRLSIPKDGLVSWRATTMSDVRKERIRALLAAGMTHARPDRKGGSS